MGDAANPLWVFGAIVVLIAGVLLVSLAPMLATCQRDACADVTHL
jgi:hypothetical protein